VSLLPWKGSDDPRSLLDRNRRIDDLWKLIGRCVRPTRDDSARKAATEKRPKWALKCGYRFHRSSSTSRLA